MRLDDVIFAAALPEAELGPLVLPEREKYREIMVRKITTLVKEKDVPGTACEGSVIKPPYAKRA